MQESEKWKWSRSVVSDSSRPHGLQPTRLLHPWDFPGKNTGVGCHCLLRYQGERERNKEMSERIRDNEIVVGSMDCRSQWYWRVSGIEILEISKRLEDGMFEIEIDVKSLSRVQLFATTWTVAYKAPLSIEFSRHEYWSGWPFPSPGDLPDPGIEPRSPALQADALLSEPPGKLRLCRD